jgi:hypothetical protein
MSARALRVAGVLATLCLFGCGSEPQSGARLSVSVASRILNSSSWRG